LKIGSFEFENASVSYPDSLTVIAAYKNKDRNGTLGANILRRFHVIYDYPGRKITLRKNSHFKKPFLYNKSGLELNHGGDMVVKVHKPRFTTDVSNDGKSITQVISSYALAYKPSYIISHLRDDSPAKNAGLLVGDIILEINGSVAYNKEMQEIINILSQKENKKIKLLVSRDGKHLKYEFFLKSMFE
jgi:type II secretory pathway component PulC